jgi:hypothetical protein
MGMNIYPFSPQGQSNYFNIYFNWKVYLFLYLIKHNTNIKTYGGMEVQLHVFLISSLDGE